MVQVEVSEGILEGELVENEYGGTFYSFKGIPFAQPPVGDLRFKAPQPPQPWKGIRSVKEFGPRCYQVDIYTKKVMGSEDCLYLNVYTPELKPNKPLPVMVWIHGGGFVCGSGEDDFYGPKFLMKKDVIVVTINYRVEVLGFLSLNTPEIPGNAGMKDQVEALKWVNKNIARFGGDSNNITIFGESAGGASVSYHTISPLSKGLFKRAIAQSGALTCNWAQADNARERALKLARNLGFESEDNKELYEFFKKQSAENFIQVQLQIYLSETAKTGIEVYLSVCDEQDIEGDCRFFYRDLIKDGYNLHKDIEILAGYTTDEGLLGLGPQDIITQKLTIAKDFPEIFVSRPLQGNLSMHKQIEVGKKIREYYFKDQISLNDWENLARFVSMDMFVFQILRYIKKCTLKKNRIYVYQFSCKTERNVISHVLGLTDVIKDKQVTCHADDTLYLFDPKFLNGVLNKNLETYKLIDTVTSLWTNFAKYGNPTPDNSLGVKWKPYTIEDQDYLDIGNQLVPRTVPYDEELQFWESIYKEYGQQLE